MSLEEFLKIAIATTEALRQIHAANIIHKDINPLNIVFNPKTGQLKIIDFGISTRKVEGLTKNYGVSLLISESTYFETGYCDHLLIVSQSKSDRSLTSPIISKLSKNQLRIVCVPVPWHQPLT